LWSFWNVQVVQQYNGSLSAWWNAVSSQPATTTLRDMYMPNPYGTCEAWTFVALSFVWAIIGTYLCSFKDAYGPVTAKGDRPKYKSGGVLYFTASLLLYYGGYKLGYYNFGFVYDHFKEIIKCLNLFALGFCALLYIKGLYFPSGPDHSATGNFIFDYYWGTELHPNMFGLKVKQVTNCRIGMTYWGVFNLAFAAKQFELYGSVTNTMLLSVLLQFVYIYKFFYWEVGYFSTLDIMYDRAGFYICWGCLVFLPSFYISPAHFLVENPENWTTTFATLIMFLGSYSIYVNYDADRQKQHFRAVNGKCKIWGRDAQYITASYKAPDGSNKESLLLVSGWWGIARHFHYIPELAASFFWSCPGGFSLYPYIYTIYLFILLTHRLFRDEERCSKKYGKHWEKYKQRVPYKMIPYIF